MMSCESPDPNLQLVGFSTSTSTSGSNGLRLLSHLSNLKSPVVSLRLPFLLKSKSKPSAIAPRGAKPKGVTKVFQSDCKSGTISAGLKKNTAALKKLALIVSCPLLSRFLVLSPGQLLRTVHQGGVMGFQVYSQIYLPQVQSLCKA